MNVIHAANIATRRAASPKRLRPAARAAHFRPVHLPPPLLPGIAGGGLHLDPLSA
jgi:hypothetical protein